MHSADSRIVFTADEIQYFVANAQRRGSYVSAYTCRPEFSVPTYSIRAMHTEGFAPPPLAEIVYYCYYYAAGWFRYRYIGVIPSCSAIQYVVLTGMLQNQVFEEPLLPRRSTFDKIAEEYQESGPQVNLASVWLGTIEVLTQSGRSGPQWVYDPEKECFYAN